MKNDRKTRADHTKKARTKKYHKRLSDKALEKRGETRRASLAAVEQMEQYLTFQQPFRFKGLSGEIMASPIEAAAHVLMLGLQGKATRLQVDVAEFIWEHKFGKAIQQHRVDGRDNVGALIERVTEAQRVYLEQTTRVVIEGGATMTAQSAAPAAALPPPESNGHHTPPGTNGHHQGV